jgi:hypothetical protein
MELRDHSAVLERPTVPSRPVAPSFDGVTPAPAPTGVAPGSLAYPSTAPPPPAKSRSVAVIVGVAVIAAALAVAITVLALRRGGEAPRDAAIAEHDASTDRWGLDRLDELRQLDKLRDLGKGLEDMRDKLHGDKPDASDKPETGRLKLTADPEATIFEGDVKLGTTPLDVRLPAGTHTLRVIYTDGRERTATIEIREGRTTRENLSTW